jgi:hypothetical protein
MRSGGGEADPLVESINIVCARLQIEFTYYRFMNNIELFIYFLGCFNDICCSIVGDKLVVND